MVADSSAAPAAAEHAFLAALGVDLSTAARRAASAHTANLHAEVLDLVPADLAPESFLDLARAVHVGSYRNSRFAPGRSAAQAICVDRELLARAGLKEREDYLPTELVAAARKLKRYAPATSDIAVVPEFRSSATASSSVSSLAARAARAARAAERVQVRSAGLVHVRRLTFGLPVARTAALVFACLAQPGWGAAAVAAWAAQPALVSAGHVAPGIRKHLTAPARRLMSWPAYLLATGGNRVRRATSTTTTATSTTTTMITDASQRRSWYQSEISAGVARFLQPRRDDCPWCGSLDLVCRAETADLVLRKPGRFRYDQCRSCGHVFQNPAPTSAGLDFYYRDFYDGLNAESAEETFGASDLGYRARVKALPASVHPRRWLDVGAGHGHFCLAAQAILPGVVFDAVDMGDGIEEAHRRGWVHQVYRSMFPDLVDEIAGRYDVISMFHYLEHTVDPRGELDAAADALPVGGHLVLEVPHAQAPSFSLFRGMWVGLAPPQHLHLISPDALAQALTERGLAVVRIQFGPNVHIPGDAIAAVYYLAQRLQPAPDLPWLPYQVNSSRRARRLAALAATTPLYPLAAVVDALLFPFMVTGRRSNAYRIVARKEVPRRHHESDHKSADHAS